MIFMEGIVLRASPNALPDESILGRLMLAGQGAMVPILRYPVSAACQIKHGITLSDLQDSAA
jgi:hypothetical protein